MPHYDSDSDDISRIGDANRDEDVVEEARRSAIVYKAILQAGDPPHIEMAADGLFLVRGDKQKHVVLIATLYHLLLFKRRTWKLYRTWPITEVVVDAEIRHSGVGPIVAITDLREDAPLDSDVQGTDWAAVKLSAKSPAAARAVAERISEVIEAADVSTQHPDPMANIRDAHARLAAGLQPNGKPIRAPSGAAAAAAANREESSSSDGGSGGEEAPDVPLAGRRSSANQPLGKNSQKKKEPNASSTDTFGRAAGGSAEDAVAHQQKQHQQARIARLCGPLTDGDMSDLSVLTEAYASNSSDQLVADLRAFVAESSAAVEHVCQNHYQSFLDGAERCARVDGSQLKTLGTDLAAHAREVTAAGGRLAMAGQELGESEQTLRQLTAAEAAVRQALELARSLERSEVAVQRGELEASVAGLGALRDGAEALHGSNCALGVFVAGRRLEQLETAALRQGVLQMNRWLTDVRDRAPLLGRHALETARQGRPRRRGPPASSGSGVFAQQPDPEGPPSSHQRTVARDGLASPPTTLSLVLLPSGRWRIRATRQRLTMEHVSAVYRNRLLGSALRPEGTDEQPPPAPPAEQQRRTSLVARPLGRPPLSGGGPRGPTSPQPPPPSTSSSPSGGGLTVASTMEAFVRPTGSSHQTEELSNGPGTSSRPSEEFAVNNGANILAAFQAAGEGEVFLACVAESRKKQLAVLLSRAPTVSTVEDFASLAESLVGFFAAENLLCYSPSEPRLRTPVDVLQAWDTTGAVVVQAAQAAVSAATTAAAAATAENFIDVSATTTSTTTEEDAALAVTLHVSETVAAMADAMEQRVTSVRLATAPLRAEVQRLRDALHGDLVRRLTLSLSDVVMSDPMALLSVTNASEFRDAVTAFQLHAAEELVSVPGEYHSSSSTGPLRLPYSMVVPQVGQALLAFVRRAYDAVDAGSAESADQNIVEFLNVALRTVAAMLNARMAAPPPPASLTAAPSFKAPDSTTVGPDSSMSPAASFRFGGKKAASADGMSKDGNGGISTTTILHPALIGANATALTVVASVVEQTLVLRWHGPVHTQPQRLGYPIVLSIGAAELRKVTSSAIDAVAKEVVQKLDQIYREGSRAKYWYRRAKNRASNGNGGTGGATDLPETEQMRKLMALEREHERLAMASNIEKHRQGRRGGEAEHMHVGGVPDARSEDDDDDPTSDAVSISTTAHTTTTTGTNGSNRYGADGSANVSVQATSYVRDVLQHLRSLWPPELVKSVGAAALMHLAEVVPAAMNAAIRQAELRETLRLRLAVDQFEREGTEPVTNLASDLGMRFPSDLGRLCEELRRYLDVREAEYAAEMAEKLQLQQGIENLAHGVVDGAKVMANGAKATAGGVVAAGKATADGVTKVGKATADGVSKVGTATRHGFLSAFKAPFRLGRNRTKANGAAAGDEGDHDDGRSSVGGSHLPSREPSAPSTPTVASLNHSTKKDAPNPPAGPSPAFSIE